MHASIRSTLAALALAGAAFAHAGPGHHDKGPNGGEVKDIGALHVEVVARPGELALFLYDNKDAKVSTAGATGKATVLVKGRKSEVVLGPDGGNGLVGKGDFVADKSLVVVVSIALSGQKTVQGRFAPLK